MLIDIRGDTDYYYFATAGGRTIWVCAFRFRRHGIVEWLLIFVFCFPQWKKYITTMQITQFVIDLFATYFASTLPIPPSLPLPSKTLTPPSSSLSSFSSLSTAYSHFAYTYTKLPVVGDCSGAESAALYGCGLLTSYLVLFIEFYRRTYKKPTSTSAGGKKSAVTVNGTGNGKAPVKVNGNGHDHAKDTASLYVPSFFSIRH